MKIRYRLWLWIGQMLGVLKQHNIDVGKNMLDVRSRLEQAMTPELREMLNEKIN